MEGINNDTIFLKLFLQRDFAKVNYLKKIKEWSTEEGKDSKKNMRNKPKKDTLFRIYNSACLSYCAVSLSQKKWA